MSAPLGQAGPQRQHRGGPVRRLVLAFLNHADHDRVGRRRQVQPDDVPDLRLQFGVGAELERLDPVRLDLPLAPDPGHAGEGDPQLSGQEPGRPVRDSQPACGFPPAARVATTTSASSIPGGRPLRGSSSSAPDPAALIAVPATRSPSAATPHHPGISASASRPQPAAPSGPAWPGPTARSAAAPDPPAAAGHPHAAPAQEQKTCSIVPFNSP